MYKFWRILPGIFLEDFSGHFFPTKMRRKQSGEKKSAKKSGDPKIKIRGKSVLPKTDPNVSRPSKQSTILERDARGASELRRGTPPFISQFCCPASGRAVMSGMNSMGIGDFFTRCIV